jgi:hypothetical protein
VACKERGRLELSASSLATTTPEPFEALIELCQGETGIFGGVSIGMWNRSSTSTPRPYWAERSSYGVKSLQPTATKHPIRCCSIADTTRALAESSPPFRSRRKKCHDPQRKWSRPRRGDWG